MVEKNREYDVFIEDLTVEGMGVGRIDGMVVFVDGLLPGERGRVLVIKKAKKYAVAKAIAIYEPSPNRVQPPCPASQRCGGCSLMSLAYSAQLAYKQKHVDRLMKTVAGVSIPVDTILPSPQELHYRNKTAFPVKQGKDGLEIGCYAKRSHHVVNASQCLLHHPNGDKALAIVRKWMAQYGISAYDETAHKGLLRHIVIRRTSLGQMMVGLVINSANLPHGQELAAAFQDALPQVKTLVANVNLSRGNVILGGENRIIFGNGHVEERICGLTFQISLNTFLQINHGQTERMYTLVMDMADIRQDQVIVDLYCGAGTMTLCGAQRAKRAYGIEIVPQAVADARANAQANNIQNVEFLCGDCKDAFARVLQKEKQIHALIVDPPRKGLDGKVIQEIAESGPMRVVYVSCDPGTLARDLQKFAEFGYEAQRIQPLDLFPMSTHVETVVLLAKKIGLLQQANDNKHKVNL